MGSKTGADPMQAGHMTVAQRGRCVAIRALEGLDALWHRDERGASMAEYGLLLTFVFLAAFLSLKFFGESLVALFETTGTTIENAPNVGSS